MAYTVNYIHADVYSYNNLVGDSFLPPIKVGSKLYIGVVYNDFSFSSLTYYLAVYSSTDDGATWTQEDTTHHPVVATSIGGINYPAAMTTDGTKFYAMYQTSSGLRVSIFDTGTDTWSHSSYGTLPGGILLNSTNDGSVVYTNGMSVSIRADGKLVGAVPTHDVDAVTGNDASLVAAAVYDTNTDTWEYFGGSYAYKYLPYPSRGTNGSPPAQNKLSNRPIATVVDSADRTHLISILEEWYSSTSVDFCMISHSVKSDNSTHGPSGRVSGLYTGRTITYPLYNGSDAVGQPAYDSASNTIAVPYINSSQQVCVALATAADVPTWSTETVDTTVVPHFSFAYYIGPICVLGARYFGSDLYVFWNKNDPTNAPNNQASGDIYWSKRTGPGTWTSPALLYSFGLGQGFYPSFLYGSSSILTAPLSYVTAYYSSASYYYYYAAPPATTTFPFLFDQNSGPIIPGVPFIS